MRNPWAFRIDYDRAIAEDLKNIADIENCLARGWVLSEKHAEEFPPPDDDDEEEGFGPFPSFDGTGPSFADLEVRVCALEVCDPVRPAPGIEIPIAISPRIIAGPVMMPIICEDEGTVRRLFASLGVPAGLLALSPRETSHVEHGIRIHEAFAASMLPYSVPLPTVEEAGAAALVRDGYKSTSNKYRNVARLPEGKTGLEALRDCAPEEYARIMEQAERQAADRYRRFNAAEHGDQETLTVDEFKAFRSAGGESSF